MKQVFKAAFSCLLMAMTGCVSDQTGALPGPVPVPVSAPRHVQSDRSQSAEHQQLLTTFGGEYKAPPTERLVSQVVEKLVSATERPDEVYRITLLNSSVVNAFALPSGRLYVTRGLLALANDASELAAVLAHEIAHITLRHALQRNELELRSALISRVVADVLNDPASGALVRDQSKFSIASFSRAQELEADQIGVRTLARAGYDPYGAIRFLNALDRQGALRTSFKNRKGEMDMLSTHPTTPERVAKALQAAREIAAPGVGVSERARYLSAIDGISFGDNPVDGVVRARTFLHPRLGVAFTAPEGFTLQNTARAVTGVGPGGEHLMFDVVQDTNRTELDDLLRSSWAESVSLGSIEKADFNGWNAVIAKASARGWHFHIALIRSQNSVFRLVTATKSDEPSQHQRFKGLAQTVRPLSAEDERGLKGLKIRVVTASAGDSVETLASRSAFEDRAMERFRVLNNLDNGASLKPGESYKIVVE
jgi:predicted Zn-dependent protease